jgi:amino acid transporter
MISELSSDYDLLSIRNIILLVIFMVISCAYIIVSFISMKKKESIKLKKALLIISCIALIFTFASRIIIRNTYSEAEYEKYYEYKNGGHAYIESFIERKEYA